MKTKLLLLSLLFIESLAHSTCLISCATKEQNGELLRAKSGCCGFVHVRAVTGPRAWRYARKRNESVSDTSFSRDLSSDGSCKRPASEGVLTGSWS